MKFTFFILIFSWFFVSGCGPWHTSIAGKIPFFIDRPVPADSLRAASPDDSLAQIESVRHWPHSAAAKTGYAVCRTLQWPFYGAGVLTFFVLDTDDSEEDSDEETGNGRSFKSWLVLVGVGVGFFSTGLLFDFTANELQKH